MNVKARKSKQHVLLKSRYLSTKCHWPSSKQTAVQWLLAAMNGTQYRTVAAVSTATPHPLQSQVSVTWPLCVCGLEFLAGCSRLDELAATHSCVALPVLEINWVWRAALTKIFFPVLCTMTAGYSAGNYRIYPRNLRTLFLVWPLKNWGA
jgi:hypothetical protein